MKYLPDSNYHTSMNSDVSHRVLTYITGGFLSFFYPIVWAFIFVVVLVLAEHITWRLRKDREIVKESKRVSVFVRWLVYLLFICLAQFVWLYVNNSLQWVKVILIGICFVELNWTDENFEGIFGFRFSSKIVSAFKFLGSLPSKLNKNSKQ